GLATDWLYSPFTLGLTWVGATGVFVVTTIGSAVWTDQRAQVRERKEGWSEQGRKAVNTIWLLAILALLAVLPLLVGSVFSQILGSVGIYVLMGLGLNIVVGYAGLLDLGYVAFFAVGAFATAIFTGAVLVTSLGTQAPVFSLHLSFYAAVPIVILIAAFVGLMIGAPVLRLRGDYLAI